VSVVPFPTQPADTSRDAVGGGTVAAAVDRYLDSVRTATTRAGYAETLARLTALAGDQAAGALAPEAYTAVMNRGAPPPRPGTGTCPRSPPSPSGRNARRSSSAHEVGRSRYPPRS
jgi:hypothetical protein